MSCIFSDTDGNCTFFDLNEPNDDLGCDSTGVCVCEDNPRPEDTCMQYERKNSEDSFPNFPFSLDEI